MTEDIRKIEKKPFHRIRTLHDESVAKKYEVEKDRRLRNLPQHPNPSTSGLVLLNAQAPQIDKDTGMRTFQCELVFGLNKKIATSYSQGSAWMSPPAFINVLACLFLDASGMDYHSFETWCGEYEYRSDSIKALNIFNACRDTRASLVRVFGDRYPALEEEIRAWEESNLNVGTNIAPFLSLPTYRL